MAKMTTTEIAKEVGIAESTARAWARQYEIPHKVRGLSRLFGHEAIEIFRTIKQLKNQSDGFNTIKRKIGVDSTDSTDTAAADNQHSGDMSANSTAISPTQQYQSTDIKELIETTITRSLMEKSELAEKYARATYTIGQQEERIKQLESQLKILPSSEQWNNAQKMIEITMIEKQNLTEQIKSLDKENKDLKQHLQQSFRTPWQLLLTWLSKARGT